MSPEERLTTFEDALRYVSSFTDYEQKAADRLRRDSLDLGRMRRIAAAFDDPQDACPVVHVAGTKGKGSVTLFVEAILRAHGLETGRFLSPHLSHVTERIAVDGRSVTPERFAELVRNLRPFVERTRKETPSDLPSFFETIALMAFLAFREGEVDVAAVEVGLGGRLDATNIVTPAVSVITNIDLEHTRVLGNTLRKIAAEKAGIIKPSRPVVVGPSPDSPSGVVIGAIAEERGAPVRWYGGDVSVTPARDSSDAFDVAVRDAVWRDLRLGVLGSHQRVNAALALAAVKELHDLGHVVLREDAIREGLATARLPGRQEPFDGGTDRFPFEGDILLDGAHTPASMRALADTVGRTPAAGGRALLVGLLRDKDVERCLEPLADLFSHVFTITPDSPRALPAADLAATVRPLFHDACHVESVDSLDAVPAALAAAECGSLVVAGSIYLAGELRPRLMKEEPQRA